jgi:hypothetical protein
MLRYRTTAAVPADSPYEAGWRAGLHGGSPLYGARTKAGARDFSRGYEGGRQERQRIAAAQARARQPLSRTAYADAFLRGATAGQSRAQAIFGSSDPRIHAAYRAGYESMQRGDVQVDRRLSSQSAYAWRVKPLVQTPAEIREMLHAIDRLPTPEDPLAQPF